MENLPCKKEELPKTLSILFRIHCVEAKIRHPCYTFEKQKKNLDSNGSSGYTLSPLNYRRL